jgi:hypothetical protein
VHLCVLGLNQISKSVCIFEAAEDHLTIMFQLHKQASGNDTDLHAGEAHFRFWQGH